MTATCPRPIRNIPSSARKLRTSNLPKRRPLRASAGHPVTQLWYARQGIITPEMEFIAIRENMRGAHAPRMSADAPRIGDLSYDIVRNDLNKQHAGSAGVPPAG